MFSYLLYPFVRWVERMLPWKHSRIVAILIPFAVIGGALAVLGVLIKEPAKREVEQLQMEINSTGFKQKIAGWTVMDVPVGQELVDNYDQTQLLTTVQQYSGQLSKGMQMATRDLVNLFIVPVLSFFLLKDGLRILNRLISLLGVGKKLAEEVLQDAHVLMLEYMQSLLLLCLSTLITFMIVLRLIQVPYPVLLGLVAFPLEFVPVAGPLTAAIIIVGVSAFNHYPHIGGLSAFLISYRLFQDYVLSPQLMNKGVKLHPLFVIFSVFAGEEINGIAGIFLSVPILAFLRLMFFEWNHRRLLRLEPSDTKVVVASDSLIASVYRKAGNI